MRTMNLCFLCGLGDSADAWRGVIDKLSSQWNITTLSLNDLCPLEQFSLDSAVSALEARLGEASRQTHLVGLSAGAMLAIRYGAKHEIASLFLSAPQVRPPKALMTIQNAIFRLIPTRSFQSSGISKQGIISTARALAQADLTADAKQITAPATIACGSKDKANLKAARLTRQLIAGSKLVIVDQAKHEWHTQLPEQFAYEITRHLNAL